MLLPRRLKRPKLNVQAPPRQIWPSSLVRSHGCCVPDCDAAAVEFAHLRSAANAGIGQKPHDAFGVSLCRIHHDEQHRLGGKRFGDKYQIDLWALAAEFAGHSPDREMRVSLKLVRAEEMLLHGGSTSRDFVDVDVTSA
jgi:hypothetical protein